MATSRCGACRSSGPGPSRGMVFQDYGLFPWLTSATTSPSARSRGAARRAEIRETVDQFIDLVGLQQFRRRLSAPAFRRHEAARGDRPRAGQRRRNRADGRAVRRARRDDARTAAGRTARDLAAHRADGDLRHAFDRGGDLPGRSRGGDVARAGAASTANMQIDLPRPRDVAGAEFNEWRRLLASQLHSPHARKAG